MTNLERLQAQARQIRRTNRYFFTFWLLLGLIPTVLFGGADAYLIYDSMPHGLAKAYQSTQGWITSSAENADGRSVDIRFHYRVGRREYEGTRYAFGEAPWPPFDTTAHDAVEQNRVGASCEVFYDPKDPGQSVINPGWRSFDPVLVMIMMPMNGAIIVLWLPLLIHMGWVRYSGHQEVEVVEQGDVTRIQFPVESPWMAALLAMILAGPVVGLALLILGESLLGRPRLDPVSISVAIGVLVTITAAAWGWYAWLGHHGSDDIVIDRGSGQLRIRVWFMWYKQCPLQAVTRVEFGDDGRQRPLNYRLVVYWKKGDDSAESSLFLRRGSKKILSEAVEILNGCLGLDYPKVGTFLHG